MFNTPDYIQNRKDIMPPLSEIYSIDKICLMYPQQYDLYYGSNICPRETSLIDILGCN